MNRDNRIKAPAAKRAAEIMKMVASAAAPPTMSEIARALSLGKSTTHNILHTLEVEGWLKRGDSGEYLLGDEFLSLFHARSGTRELVELSRPFLDEVSAEFDLSVCMGTWEGNEVLIRAVARGGGGMKVSVEPGLALPFMTPAVGRAILLALGPGERSALVKKSRLPSFTERSITDSGKYLEEVERSANRGYAVDDEEYLRGVRAVAAPLKAEGAPVGALWAVGFTHSIDELRLRATGEALVRATSLISRLAQ